MKMNKHTLPLGYTLQEAYFDSTFIKEKGDIWLQALCIDEMQNNGAFLGGGVALSDSLLF